MLKSNAVILVMTAALLAFSYAEEPERDKRPNIMLIRSDGMHADRNETKNLANMTPRKVNELDQLWLSRTKKPRA